MIPFPARLAEGMHRPETMPPPPKLGEHSAAILGELGYSPAEVTQLVRDCVLKLHTN